MIVRLDSFKYQTSPTGNLFSTRFVFENNTKQKLHKSKLLTNELTSNKLKLALTREIESKEWIKLNFA